MNADVRYIVLIVIAAIGLLKALFAIIGPGVVKRFVSWWRDAGAMLHKVGGGICIVFAGLLLAVVLMQHEIVDWILMLLAVLMAWGANLYFREDDVKKLLDSVILKRGDNFLRAISLCSGAICGILLWIAITGLLAQ
ncbi:MAG: hypothetical protein ISS31_09740 [Kiritimatiellae bacterium]|nr:hypothetical protein [Kiritimatiellia bacterium]